MPPSNEQATDWEYVDNDNFHQELPPSHGDADSSLKNNQQLAQAVTSEVKNASMVDPKSSSSMCEQTTYKTGDTSKSDNTLRGVLVDHFDLSSTRLSPTANYIRRLRPKYSYSVQGIGSAWARSEMEERLIDFQSRCLGIVRIRLEVSLEDRPFGSGCEELDAQN